MKTLLMIVAMAASVVAQDEGNRQEEKKKHEGQMRMLQVEQSAGTLLDMVDGTGAGVFYSMGAREGSGGGIKMVEGGAGGTKYVQGSGGGVAMPAGSRANWVGGGTLLDLVDR